MPIKLEEVLAKIKIVNNENVLLLLDNVADLNESIESNGNSKEIQNHLMNIRAATKIVENSI